MLNIKKYLLLATTLLFSICAFAQNLPIGVKSEKQDFMRSGGKIYVVMLIVLTILAGLIIYVVRLDKKMSRLEQNKS